MFTPLEELAICRQHCLLSSGASVKPYNGWSAYGCSKAALNHFAMDIASEEPSDKVRAVCIAPGVVDTQMQKDIRETLGPSGHDTQGSREVYSIVQDFVTAGPKGACGGRSATRPEKVFPIL